MPRGAQKPDPNGTRSMAEKALDRKQLQGATFDQLLDAASVALYYEQTPPLGEWTQEEGRRYGAAAAKAAPDVALRHLGAALASARGRAHICRKDAAEAAGMSLSTLKRTEQGKRDNKITIDEVIKLCAVYDTHIERVLGIMSAEEEELLRAYRDATQSIRPMIVKAAKLAQAGATREAQDLIEQDKADTSKRMDFLREVHDVLDGVTLAEWVGKGDAPSIEVRFDET